MTPSLLTQTLEELAHKEGLPRFGWSPLERPLSFEFYREWIKAGAHGQMKYLEDHLPLKEHPRSRFPKIQSAFVFAVPYRPHPAPVADFPFRFARIASYAQGRDYHHWLKERLQRIADALQKTWPAETFEIHTDSSPILERDLAHRSGLGWFGKNTCLIDRKSGSFFLIGEILTSMSPPQEGLSVSQDFCGTCTRCLEACPTQALASPRRMDATRCISYLSIESRELPPESLRASWGDWLFGCDICQSVCPWNQKPFQIKDSEKFPLEPLEPPQTEGLTEELRWVLTASGKSLEKALRGSALSRAGSFGLKRNALIVAGNRKMKSLEAEIQKLMDHERLGPLAQWALEQINRD